MNPATLRRLRRQAPGRSWSGPKAAQERPSRHLEQIEREAIHTPYAGVVEGQACPI